MEGGPYQAAAQQDYSQAWQQYYAAQAASHQSLPGGQQHLQQQAGSAPQWQQPAVGAQLPAAPQPGLPPGPNLQQSSSPSSGSGMQFTSQPPQPQGNGPLAADPQGLHQEQPQPPTDGTAAAQHSFAVPMPPQQAPSSPQLHHDAASPVQPPPPADEPPPLPEDPPAAPLPPDAQQAPAWQQHGDPPTAAPPTPPQQHQPGGDDGAQQQWQSAQQQAGYEQQTTALPPQPQQQQWGQDQQWAQMPAVLQQQQWQQYYQQQQAAGYQQQQQPAWSSYQTASYPYSQSAYQVPYSQQWGQQPAYAGWQPQPQQIAQPAASGPHPAAASAQWPPAASNPAVSAPAAAAAPVQQVPPPLSVADLLEQPGRATRASKIAVLLRGPPGSGKSAAARKMREAEQRAGGEPLRIHSIDDYFVTDVEREVADEKRPGRKRKVTEMEYLHEPELEASYEASLLKAFGRTLDEGRFRFVVVDAPLLAAAQLKQYWHAGQAAGFEVYVARPLSLDAEVCAARDTHGRGLEDVRRAIEALEPPPPAFLQLDLSALFEDRRAPAKAAAAAVPPAAASAEQPQQGGSGSPNADVDMAPENSSGSDASPADGIAPGGSDEEGDSLLGATVSRWGALDEDGDEPSPSRKKRRTAAVPDDGDAFRTPAPSKTSAARLRGILSTGGRSSAQRVRWADEGADDGAGAGSFSLGGASREQLETVYVLEDLGPPMGAEQRAHLSDHSFQDAVKGEHSSEQQLFRDHLFGGRRS